ncbi:hypothetical protein BGW36DRAFT_379489 [Talaromyces proteolyticus]|uniref:Zn(2)-C6 fungal-type domain-containing protein n=1 Tax=Talaromyces proteolyticus TaxID=1131652 RepID=A0AAD4KQ39_9EURO|nr:uncharacterized protein BGW36DRAFT_379489 [Talaromyces proteolyticus]KAH8697793.1 hypothetical protein BGW36DRAFT_379489 [Talaromyces proteolyticus]
MAGTPKSTGCSTCRRRKKKCGEERPSCKACISNGWVCPGYAKRWKFVDGNAQVSTNYQVKTHVHEREIFNDTTNIRHGDQTRHEVKPHKKSQLMYDISWQKYSRRLTSESDGLASMLVFILNDSLGQKFCQIGSHANFLDYIPSRLGINIALDSVVSSLCSLYIDTLTRKRTFKSLQLYGRGISSLQACLKDPKQRLESETLCASLLLQVCELLRNPGNSRWFYLSKGSRLLFESAGPERCASGFDRAMIESQRVWFMIQDVGRHQHCFLTQPQWQEVFKVPITTPVDVRNPILSLRTRVCEVLNDVPDILSEVACIALTDENQIFYTKAHQEDLICRLIIQKESIQRWYTTELQPLLCGGGDSRYSAVVLAVIDFISSSALLAVIDALSTMTSKSEEYGLNGLLPEYQPAIIDCETAVRASLNYIIGVSSLVAEPLQIATQQTSLLTSHS